DGRWPLPRVRLGPRGVHRFGAAASSSTPRLEAPTDPRIHRRHRGPAAECHRVRGGPPPAEPAFPAGSPKESIGGGPADHPDGYRDLGRRSTERTAIGPVWPSALHHDRPRGDHPVPPPLLDD